MSLFSRLSLRQVLLTSTFGLAMLGGPALAQSASDISSMDEAMAASAPIQDDPSATALPPPTVGQGMTAQQANGKPLALVFLQQSGVALSYLGNAGGVRGYLGVSPDGRHNQTFYIWPNGIDFVVGPMYDAQGNNTTSQQIEAMQKRFVEAATGRPIDPVAESIIPQLTMVPNQDPSTIPALARAAAAGDTLLYLGGDGGAPGYLQAIAPQGKKPAFQTIYVTPDGQHVVLGMMLGYLGDSVTGHQVTAAKNAPLVQDAILGEPIPKQQVAPASNASNTSTVAASYSPIASSATPETSISAPASPANGGMSAPGVSSSGEDLIEPPPPVAQVSKAAFMSALANAAKFPVGYADAPVVYMVADPQCPHCHAAWDVLRPMVMAHKIRVQVILVDGLPGSDRYNEEIMTNLRPGLAWLDGWGSSDDTALIQPSATATQADYQNAATWLGDNMDFIHTLGINGTPFIAYQGKDGIWRAEQGPLDVQAFMSGDD